MTDPELVAEHGKARRDLWRVVEAFEEADDPGDDLRRELDLSVRCWGIAVERDADRPPRGTPAYKLWYNEPLGVNREGEAVVGVDEALAPQGPAGLPIDVLLRAAGALDEAAAALLGLDEEPPDVEPATMEEMDRPVEPATMEGV